MIKLDKKTAMTNLLIFVAVVFVINLISLNLFFRLDFSKGSVYSLSKASKSALKQLEDRMLVKAYFTEDLPPQFASIRRYTRDLLEEYKNASGGKFRYEFIDPKDENKLREDAQKGGVFPVNINVRENDRMEVRQAYLGLVLNYNDKMEPIPLVQETRGLEYEITKAITKIASLGIPKVAFYGLTPDLPDNPQMRFFMQQRDKYQDAKESIRQNYELVNTTLLDPIPQDVTTLVFSGAVDSLSVQQLYNIDQFLMKGKNILFFQDRAFVTINNLESQQINSNIFDLLNHYGVKIVDNLVLDAKSGSLNVPTMQGWFQINTQVQYPFIPISNSVNKSSPIVSQLSDIQFLFVSEIDSTNVAGGVKITPLIYSSDNSSTNAGPYYNIYINQFMMGNKDWMNNLTQKGKILSALYEGNFRSYFADTDVRFGSDFIAESPNGKIVAVADMDFIDSQGVGSNISNKNFLMNAVDYLSNNTGLITLRSREVINKPLKIERLVNTEGLTQEVKDKKEQRARNFIKVTNIILPSLLLILYGFYRYKSEINRRKRIREIYE